MITLKLMLHAGTGFTAAIATGLAASVTPGPFSDLFSDNALAVSIYGAFGGLTRWIFLKDPWKDGMRAVTLGALLATGVGTLWHVLVSTYLGDIPDGLLAQPETARTGAYLVGLSSVLILGRFIDSKESESDE